MAIPRLQLDQTALLVVDVQDRLMPHMHNTEKLIDKLATLIDGAKVIGLPILVTEQYRKGLGRTVPEIAKRLDKALCNHEKLKFSACIEPVRELLARHNIRTVLVCGIEAHVCVLQTCLDLAGSGFVTAVVTDAISSRRQMDQDTAVQRMIQAGVLPTTVESCLLELVHEAGTERFKAILPVIK